MRSVIECTTYYYSCSAPYDLQKFRWITDGKDKKGNKNNFQDLIAGMIAPRLRTLFADKPAKQCERGNYRYLEHSYKLRNSEKEQYLISTAGHRHDPEGWNLNRLLSDFKFVDSTESEGVQAVDILASAVRKFLKFHFEEYEESANTIGQLFFSFPDGPPPIQFRNFGPSDILVDQKASDLVVDLWKHARRFN